MDPEVPVPVSVNPRPNYCADFFPITHEIGLFYNFTKLKPNSICPFTSEFFYFVILDFYRGCNQLSQI